MPWTRVMKVYPICMLFIPINGNEDGKSGWCECCYFLQYSLAPIDCTSAVKIHENVENKISDFWLHKAQNVRACHV